MASTSRSTLIPHINSANKIAEIKTVTEKDADLSFDVSGSDSGFLSRKLTGGSTEPLSANEIINGREKANTEYRTFSTADYHVDDETSLNTIMNRLNKTLYLPSPSSATDTPQKIFEKTVNYYNRFKVLMPDNVLQKGFPHVFFVRPNCNILQDTNTLRDELKANETFMYTWNSAPSAVKQLTKANGISHDFMLSLSNAAASFSLSDEYINTDTYGRTFTGYKIAYGKNNIESKTAGTFEITYNDTHDLHIYQIHRLWDEYINGVYRGSITPAKENIVNKILDYVGAVYYFLTAEDGETIIFWSKYYGVFPSTVPSSQYSWGEGNVITDTKLSVTYQFSFKEDFNPYSILEFNHNANISNGITYEPTYNPELGHSGNTWVGAPFIEVIKNNSEGTYEYKLRFRKK